MPRRPEVYLADMLAAAQKVEQYRRLDRNLFA